MVLGSQPIVDCAIRRSSVVAVTDSTIAAAIAATQPRIEGRAPPDDATAAVVAAGAMEVIGAGEAAAATGTGTAPRGTPRAITNASVRSFRSGEGTSAIDARTAALTRPTRSSSTAHASQPAMWAATACASGVSPAISRSSPPGSTAASSSASRTAS